MTHPLPELPLILVVDDSQLEQRYVGKLLASYNEWRVAFARNGAEALAAIERQPPAAVLTDLPLPVQDGLAFVEKIRERFPLVPVVLMTASGSERVAVDAPSRRRRGLCPQAGAGPGTVAGAGTRPRSFARRSTAASAFSPG